MLCIGATDTGKKMLQTLKPTKGDLKHKTLQLSRYEKGWKKRNASEMLKTLTSMLSKENHAKMQRD